MSRTPSTMLELGTPAPDFNLPSPLDRKNYSLDDFRGKPILVVFSCNHCPYVIHILDEFVAYTDDYMPKGLNVVMINANDVANYPDDSPEKMVELIKERNINFHYLYDESQSSAQEYQAACTPDFFLFGSDTKLAYRGQFDSSRPRNDDPVNGIDLRAATDAVLAGKEPVRDQLASLGCNIKWKEGNEPAYFG